MGRGAVIAGWFAVRARQYVRRRLGAVATLAGAVRAAFGRSSADLSDDMRAFQQDGGLYVTRALGPGPDGRPMALGMLVQPDGDVIVAAPARFGAPGANAEVEAEAIRALMRDASRRLARIVRSGPLAWAHVVCTLFDVALAAAWASALFTAWTEHPWRIAAFLAAILARFAVPPTLKALAPWAAHRLHGAILRGFQRPV